MRSVRNKEAYQGGESSELHISKALQVGLVAISSALVGGFAAAWWHRKTLAKLQNPILSMDIPKTGFLCHAEMGAEEDADLPFS